MNTDIKARWVTALRSGEYQQGTGALVAPGEDGVTRYCCLGVLCELAAMDGATRRWPGGGYGFSPARSSSTYLPGDVVEWAGLGHYNPEVVTRHDKEFRSLEPLSRLNDIGHSFTEIAALIEEHL